MIKEKKEENPLKKLWKFLQEDSWQSLAVFLILALIFIKYIFFPAMAAITGTQLPLVIVESCSMYHHEKGFETIFDKSIIYEDQDITLEDSGNWDFQNGLNKGDVIFVIGDNTLETGDVIIFTTGEQTPIIHRLIDNDEPYATKGDNFKTNSQQLPIEKAISKEQVIGRAVFRVPYIGWVKLFFFDMIKPDSERGFCK